MPSLRNARSFPLLVLALLLAAPGARADRVHLKSGGVLEGRATREEGQVRVVLSSGVVVVLPAADVERIERTVTARELYEEQLAALERTDAEGHYRLGLLCAENGMREEAEALFRHAVKVMPDHEGARAALGEVFWDGRWLPIDEARKAQGYVRYKDRWVEPELYEELTARDAEQRARAEIRSAVKRIRLDIDSPARDAAIREVAAQKTPAALEPLLDFASYPHPDVRRAVATALGAYPTEERAARTLARLAGSDGDLDVQEAAAASIRAARMDRACHELLVMYADDSRAWVRNASAYALGKIRYKPAAPALVATLTYKVRTAELVSVDVDSVARHMNGRRYVVQSLRRRIYGLTPSCYRVVEKTAFNDAARQALKALSGVDLDFDGHAWVGWWRGNWNRFDDFMVPVAPVEGAEAEAPEVPDGGAPQPDDAPAPAPGSGGTAGAEGGSQLQSGSPGAGASRSAGRAAAPRGGSAPTGKATSCAVAIRARARLQLEE